MPLESRWLFPQVNTYFHFWLCETFCGNIQTSHFLAFFFLWSILIFATLLEVVLDALILYIQRSWTPKNLSVDPWLQPLPYNMVYCTRGGSRGGNCQPKTDKSNFFHHNFVKFGKQHSRNKAIFSSILLSQKCCEIYLISLTVAKPWWDLTTKYYWNRPHNLTGWTSLCIVRCGG